MRTSTMVHCEYEQSLNISLSDIQNGFDCEYRTLHIGDATIFMTPKQAEELCEVVETALYDDATYKELNTICMNQQARIEELEEQLRAASEVAADKEHLSFQDVL